MLTKNKLYLREALITVSILQVFSILIFAWVCYLKVNCLDMLLGVTIPPIKNFSMLALCSSSILAVAMIYFVFELLKITKLEHELLQEKTENEMSQNTINLLRSHRHDFLNHLQVVMGYIQLKKSDAAMEYLREINQELRSIRIVSGLKIPELVVLLFTKKSEGAKYNINLEYDINTDLKELPIKNIDMVRILANLIDNAFYEIKNNAPTDDLRLVKVTFKQVAAQIIIKVKNTGSFVKDKNKIFEYGYTTKGNNGSGIGLHNVKNLVVKKYGGTIVVDSSLIEGTIFTISFNLKQG